LKKAKKSNSTLSNVKKSADTTLREKHPLKEEPHDLSTPTGEIYIRGTTAVIGRLMLPDRGKHENGIQLGSDSWPEMQLSRESTSKKEERRTNTSKELQAWSKT